MDEPDRSDAKIARMKDGSTHLAFKPEHAVDLDTGVVVAAPIHSADAGDTATLGPTLEETQQNLTAPVLEVARRASVSRLAVSRRSDPAPIYTLATSHRGDLSRPGEKSIVIFRWIFPGAAFHIRSPPPEIGVRSSLRGPNFPSRWSSGCPPA